MINQTKNINISPGTRAIANQVPMPFRAAASFGGGREEGGESDGEGGEGGGEGGEGGGEGGGERNGEGGEGSGEGGELGLFGTTET